MKTHGLRRTHFYGVYTTAKGRCENPNHSAYPRYGRRGIEFKFASFEHFRDVMYEDYVTHCAVHGRRFTSLERIDNSGDYSPENCRWATRREQAYNREPRFDAHNPMLGVRKSNSRWMARIVVAGKQLYLGTFDTPLQAHRAYLKARSNL